MHNLFQTVLLRELTDQIASLKEQELWDCLYRVVSSLKTGFVLPGGAKTEINCMKICEKRAGTVVLPFKWNTVFQQ